MKLRRAAIFVSVMVAGLGWRDVALMLNPKANLAEGQIRDARSAAPA